MATYTTAVDTPRQHFDLNQLSAILMDRKRVPVGFFVSLELWKTIEQRFRDEGSTFSPDAAPTTLHGIKVAIDPSMPDLEFDVAFTLEAWRDRLKQLGIPAEQTED